MTSPFIAIGSPLDVFCTAQGRDLIAYTGNDVSICNCKLQGREQNSSACYSLLNYTSIVGPTVNCSLDGCPNGMRPYTTGSYVSCNDQFTVNGEYNSYNLFETACQGVKEFGNATIFSLILLLSSPKRITFFLAMLFSF